ncbi:MAG: hypothetical protein WEF86_11080 [Gemmatimonadota bacterium]
MASGAGAAGAAGVSTAAATLAPAAAPPAEPSRPGVVPSAVILNVALQRAQRARTPAAGTREGSTRNAV